MLGTPSVRGRKNVPLPQLRAKAAAATMPSSQEPGGWLRNQQKSNTAKVHNERSVIARIGAHALHSKYDSREVTKAAREKFLDRFERQVDPEGVLDPVERARRVKHAKTAYFTDMGRRSGRSRRKKQDY